MIHPAKKPMEGGFSMDKFMEGVSKEDGEALADMLDEFEPDLSLDEDFDTVYYIDYNSMDVRSCYLRPGQIGSTHYIIKDDAWDALLKMATEDALLWASAVKSLKEYHPTTNTMNMLKVKARRSRLALVKAVYNCGKDWAAISWKEVDEQNG